MIVTRGYGKPKAQQRKGGKITVYGYGQGIPVIFYAIVASSQRKPRSLSSFEQLMIQGSSEVSMLVGTFSTTQEVESSEAPTEGTSSRSSTDSSSTMDSMAGSSHEHSQEARSSEPATDASSSEYDETQESLNKAEQVDNG